MKQRPQLGQKSVIPGSGTNAQDAVWKCFKGQVQCDTPVLARLSFPFLMCFPPGVFIAPMLPPCCSYIGCCLCWLLADSRPFFPPMSAGHASFPSALCSDHGACSLNSLHMHLTRSFRGDGIAYTTGTRHSTSWALLPCGHFLGPSFMNPQIFSKCIHESCRIFKSPLNVIRGDKMFQTLLVQHRGERK